MMPSTTSSLAANGNVSFPNNEQWTVGERTPLLRASRNERVTVKRGAVGVVQIDEEAIRCDNIVADKQPPGPETPRNVAGVISVLLLGTYLAFCFTSQLSTLLNFYFSAFFDCSVFLFPFFESIERR